MIFLRIYRHFQSLLFLKTKEMEKEILHLGPWTSFFFSPWVPGWFEKQRRDGRPESGVGAHRRRGRSGGKARGERALPRDGLGWGWDGRSGRLREEQRPAAVVCGGGGGPVVGGGDERVEEHQGEARKLVTGFAGREGGRKSELRGDLERGGANGGGGDSGRREGARPGAQSREERGGEVEGMLAKQWEGGEQDREWGARRLARHGSVVAARRRTSTCANGNGNAWQSREATREARDGARRESGAWPAAVTPTATTA